MHTMGSFIRKGTLGLEPGISFKCYKTISTHDLLEENIILLHWKAANLSFALKREHCPLSLKTVLLTNITWKRGFRTRAISALFASCAEMQETLGE